MPSTTTTITSAALDRLRDDLIDYLVRRDLFDDVIIYEGGKRYLSSGYGCVSGLEPAQHVTRKGTEVELWVETARASEYLEFANDDTLSMAFEGPLYDAMNYGNGAVESDLQRIFERYALYFEMGDAWNLTAYPC